MSAENQSSPSEPDTPYIPTQPLGPREPLEGQLLRTMQAIVQTPEMNLPNMVKGDERLQMAQDAPKGGIQRTLPRNIDQYRFVPIVRVKGCNEAQLSGPDYGIPSDVQTHYDEGPDEKPVLDAPIGIGIAIDKEDGSHLCAVSTAEANQETNTIDVKQIQGSITTEGVKPELGGFNWPETFVKAWENIAGHVGASAVTIQASETLTGPLIQEAAAAGDTRAQTKLRRYGKRYNRTAERMGYSREDSSQPYGKPIEGQQLSPPSVDSGTGEVSAYKRILQAIIYKLENPGGPILGNILASRYQLVWASEELETADLVNDVEFTSNTTFSSSTHDGYERIQETYAQIAKNYEPDIISVLRRAADLLRDYEAGL